MKILYGIQGTGHGHISRAREILPLLSGPADVDVLISGYNSQMKLDDVNVIHKRGISLTYDSGGSVSYLKTALNIQPVRFLQDLQTLDINGYDLVITDYEPLTAWAALNSKVPCVGVSHQASFLSENSPRPFKRSIFAEQILRHFAPCNRPVGFHFQRYDNFILPPIIRSEVRELETEQRNHVTVYLPAFDHETLTTIFNRSRQTEWHIFSPLCEEAYQRENVIVRPVGNRPFLESLKSGIGVITASGFETCAEAMYLGKKLLSIPIRNQYEQLCNAAALNRMGVRTVESINASFDREISEWLNHDSAVKINEIADTRFLCEQLLRFTGRRKRTLELQS